MNRMKSALLAVTSLWACQFGCGGDPFPLAAVTGTVTYQGSPVPNATVVFQPAGGPPAIANTNDEGRYELITSGRRGVMPGTSQVSITALEPLEHEVNAASLDPDIAADDPAAWEASLTAADLEAMANRRSLIPEKYGNLQTSGLTAEIRERERNEVNFELVD